MIVKYKKHFFICDPGAQNQSYVGIFVEIAQNTLYVSKS